MRAALPCWAQSQRCNRCTPTLFGAGAVAVWGSRLTMSRSLVGRNRAEAGGKGRSTSCALCGVCYQAAQAITLSQGSSRTAGP